MIEFLFEFLLCLAQEIFWTSFIGIGSVLTSQMFKLRITKIIEAELQENIQIIKNMRSRESSLIPSSEDDSYFEIFAVQKNDALRRNIDLKFWHKFWWKFAILNFAKYQKYYDINRHAEAIVNATMEPPAMRLMVQIDAAKDFVKSYDKAFGTTTETEIDV